MMCLLIATAFLTHYQAPSTPGVLEVTTYGAKPDGVTDNTAAFQKALDECGKAGGTVDVPPGRYLLAGTLNVPESVTLQGSFHAPARPIAFEKDLAAERGSILLTTFGKGLVDAQPFITLNRSSTLKGLIVFYPDQATEVVPFPWCVQGKGDNCSILDTMLVNPYRAVDFGTFPSWRHYINGLYAQALQTGIYIDQSQDVGRVENVHFWPFWSDDKKLWAWTSQFGTAFLIGRTDWESMTNCFDIFYSIGYHFIAGKTGSANVILTNCGSDTGPVAVKVDAVQLHAGISFVNGQFMSSVEVGPENTGPVKFTSCGFWGVAGFTDEQARLRGFGQTTFTACHFYNGAQMHKDAFTIDAFSGGVTVSGCEFLDLDPKGNHIRLGEGVRTAVVMGNTFRSPIHITNKSHGQVAILANVTAASDR
jgi:hypothetical protein